MDKGIDGIIVILCTRALLKCRPLSIVLLPYLKIELRYNYKVASEKYFSYKVDSL